LLKETPKVPRLTTAFVAMVMAPDIVTPEQVIVPLKTALLPITEPSTDPVPVNSVLPPKMRLLPSERNVPLAVLTTPAYCPFAIDTVPLSTSTVPEPLNTALVSILVVLMPPDLRKVP
jgi:hypothetical protein